MNSVAPLRTPQPEQTFATIAGVVEAARGFRARQTDRAPAELAAPMPGPYRTPRTSVRARQRRLERRSPQRPWRTRWARRFPMAEPTCLAISSRKVCRGSRTTSKRHIASSHQKDRVHALTPRPTNDGIGFTVERGQRKSAPHRRDAPRSRGPVFGHTPTTTGRNVPLGQAASQSGRSAQR